MKNKQRLNNRRGGGILQIVGGGIVGISTLGGLHYVSVTIGSMIRPQKKRIFDVYDDDVISETNEIVTDRVKNNQEVDYDEILNRKQEEKNFRKLRIEKKNKID